MIFWSHTAGENLGKNQAFIKICSCLMANYFSLSDYNRLISVGYVAPLFRNILKCHSQSAVFACALPEYCF